MSQLQVTLKYGESVHVGEDISFTVIRQKGGQLAVSISAPVEMKIRRQERFEKDLLEKESKEFEQHESG